MTHLDIKICRIYDSGKTVNQIRRRFHAKGVVTQNIVDALIVHHTRVLYNVLTNKYDSVIVPSKINYNIRLYDKAKLHNSKR